MKPDYKKIYNDILDFKYPEKRKICDAILNQKELTFIDILRLNELIFNKKTKKTAAINQRYRSYDETAILKILKYQKENKLNNTQVANHFKMSRNTISKWKKLFKVEKIDSIS